MKFHELASYIFRIDSTSSRLSITEILSDLFKKLSSEEMKETVYLLQGRILPSYRGVEFGMAEKLVIKSIVLALHIDRDLFMKQYRKIGDLGKTVEILKKEIRSFEERKLSIHE